jgi:hypothetical protein
MVSDKDQTKKMLARISDYKKVFESPLGKKVLLDMMRAHKITSSTFVPNDINSTLLNEGERNVVLRILAILKTNPEDYAQRIEESTKNAY